ncbi:amidase signature enzyme [Marasmius fiardii PR-910]|nr:amidase signature enzyme [Marasmius fiardii PR-910]
MGDTTDESIPDLLNAGILQLQVGLDGGLFTSVELVQAYLARIDEVNLKGPSLRAVLEVNPNATKLAETSDKERRTRGKRSLLHGIPVLLKDNIATVSSEGMNTTAGSYALLDSVVPDDAGIVKCLRDAGAIILGKTNMSELAHFRGKVPCGWSARGGQCTSAYHPQGDPCGSSSGSGVAASVGLATVTIGTETDGSICFPSSNNNVVGIKPTVGLTSRAGVIPISSCQDTVGPMTRTVEDAAIVLSIIAGEDENDDRSLAQPRPVPDYTNALNRNALQGKRIGVPRMNIMGGHFMQDPYSRISFNEALRTVESLGATIVDPADFPSAKEMGCWENTVLNVDFKIELNRYLEWLGGVPSGVRTLTDLINFNNEHKELELPEHYDDQSRLIASDATSGRDTEWAKALARNLEQGATRGIDAVMKEHNLDALVLLGCDTSTPAALAGYPIVTVPLDFYPENTTITKSGPNTVYPAPGLPFGLNFVGSAFSEYDLIGFAYAFEQKTKARLRRRPYPEAIPKTQLKDVISFPT